MKKNVNGAISTKTEATKTATTSAVKNQQNKQGKKPDVEIVKPATSKPIQNQEPKIEDILGYGDKVINAKKRLKWFDEKLKDLSAFQKSYEHYLANSSDDIISNNSREDFEFSLTLSHSTPGNYGKGEDLIEITNPHVLNAFVAELTTHIQTKRQEAIAQLKQLDKEYAKRFIRQ